MVVKAKPEEKQDPAIVSAKQTGVKTVTVETNFDANNSKISLMKGTSAVEEKHTISEDGKTITFATTATLVAGKYTVKVDELSQDFEATTSKVDKIEFLSDKAALAGKQNGVYKKATVGYQVLNQFGDDITKSVSLTVNASCTAVPKPSEHMIEFTAPDQNNGFMIGRDIITVSLLDTTSGINATATLSISAEAYAADLTFEGVYNADGKTLTEDTIFENDDFYVLFSAKDQYGNKYKNYKSIVEGTDLYLTVIGGLSGLSKYSDGQTFIVLNKDGVDYLAYPLGWASGITPTAGTATVQMLSTGGGTCSGEITVAEGGRVASLTVSQNGVVVAGEENELSYTALDASGKEVTSYKHLRNITITGGTANYSLSFERNTDGTAKLVLDANNATVAKDNTTMLSYSFKTMNNKFSTVLIQVSENARPVAIDGLRDVDTTISGGTSYVDIKLKNLKIEDQYGRILSESAVEKMAKNTDSDSIYNLNTLEASVVKTSVVAVSSGAIATTSANVTFTSSASKNDVLFQIIPKGKGTEPVTLKIENNANAATKKLADASVDVNFTVKDTTSVTTATAKVNSVYSLATDSNGNFSDTNAQEYAQNVEVRANGALLSRADYTVTAPWGLKVITAQKDGTPVWAVYSDVARDSFDNQFKNKTATTVTRTLTITLNGTGEKLTTDVVVDTTSPKITTLSDFTGKINPVSGDAINAANLFNGPASTKVSASWIGDQYGKTVTNNDDGTFTFKDGSTATASYNFVCTVPYGEGYGAPVSLVNNNTKNATMTVGKGFAGATLTINFGGITKDVKVAPVY